ncbi:MAG: site-2 protease family protein, partial [Candidatus Diapherotrites archaeon]|nr:site-2 protease family protein [Candidatus Diapherotrites archaeon]
MEFDFISIILIFFVVSAIVTFLLKKFTKADTWFLISLIKTKKPLPWFDRLSKHTKFIDTFASIGLVIGFGAFAVDYLFGKKYSMKKRILLFIASVILLSLFIHSVDSLLGNPFSQSVIVGSLYPLLVLSFGVMGFAGFSIFALFLQAFDIISKYLLGLKSCPGVAPLIPGVEIPGVPITPPLHAWLSLLIILVVHEGFHGIVARRHNFKIKSSGVLLLGFLPIGAFVEPDDKKVKEAKAERLLPFLAAGPMANIILMVLTGLIVFASLAVLPIATESFFPGVQDSILDGVVIAGVSEETSFCGSTYPASAFNNLEEGDRIL